MAATANSPRTALLMAWLPWVWSDEPKQSARAVDSRSTGVGGLVERVVRDQQEVVKRRGHGRRAGRLHVGEGVFPVRHELRFREADRLGPRLALGTELVPHGLDGRLGLGPRGVQRAGV